MAASNEGGECAKRSASPTDGGLRKRAHIDGATAAIPGAPPAQAAPALKYEDASGGLPPTFNTATAAKPPAGLGSPAGVPRPLDTPPKTAPPANGAAAGPAPTATAPPTASVDSPPLGQTAGGSAGRGRGSARRAAAEAAVKAIHKDARKALKLEDVTLKMLVDADKLAPGAKALDVWTGTGKKAVLVASLDLLEDGSVPLTVTKPDGSVAIEHVASVPDIVRHVLLTVPSNKYWNKLRTGDRLLEDIREDYWREFEHKLVNDSPRALHATSPPGASMKASSGAGARPSKSAAAPKATPAAQQQRPGTALAPAAPHSAQLHRVHHGGVRKSGPPAKKAQPDRENRHVQVPAASPQTAKAAAVAKQPPLAGEVGQPPQETAPGSPSPLGVEDVTAVASVAAAAVQPAVAASGAPHAGSTGNGASVAAPAAHGGATGAGASGGVASGSAAVSKPPTASETLAQTNRSAGVVRTKDGAGDEVSAGLDIKAAQANLDLESCATELVNLQQQMLQLQQGIDAQQQKIAEEKAAADAAAAAANRAADEAARAAEEAAKKQVAANAALERLQESEKAQGETQRAIQATQTRVDALVARKRHFQDLHDDVAAAAACYMRYMKKARPNP